MSNFIEFNSPILSGININNDFIISAGGGGKKFGLPNKLYLINKDYKILDEIDTQDKMIDYLSKNNNNLIFGISDNIITPFYLDVNLKIKVLQEIKICENNDEDNQFKGKLSLNGDYFCVYNTLNNNLYIYTLNFNIVKHQINLKLKKKLEINYKIIDININGNYLNVTLSNEILIIDLELIKNIFNYEAKGLVSSFYFKNNILIIQNINKKLHFNILRYDNKEPILNKVFDNTSKISNLNFYENKLLLGDVNGYLNIFHISQESIYLINKIKLHQFPINGCGIFNEAGNYYFSTSSDKKLCLNKITNKKILWNYSFLIFSLIIVFVSYLIKTIIL